MQPLTKCSAPKRARSGYFLWCDDVRARVVAGAKDPEIEGKSMAVASKVLASRWASLPDDEKGVYAARADELKAATAAAKSEGGGGGGGRRMALPAGWRSSRDAISGAIVYTCVAPKKSQWERPTDADAVNMPPTPASARRLYDMHRAAARPAELPDWPALSAEERAPYEASAATARAEYAAKLKALR